MRRSASQPGLAAVGATHAPGAAERASLDLGFPANADWLDFLTPFLGAFFERIAFDPPAAARLVLATHELVENAIKYSTDGAARLKIDVHPDTGHVTVQTINRADAHHIASLYDELAAIAAAPDVRAHYQTLMRRAAGRKEGSGLGLGRIGAEADMALRLEMRGDLAELSATTRTPVAGR